ncbi:transposable element Tc1 transposase [Trichonephila clavipes]|nr:transposable element Tc1 transposase [Trichonephila clavipes]
MSLEVDSDDFQELPEPHNQELGIDELIEMHEQDIEEHCVFKPSEIRRSNDGRGKYSNQAKNRTTTHFHGSRKANYCWKCGKNFKDYSAPKLTTDVKNNFAKSCNPETIRRVLRKAGYHGRNMQRKPFVSEVSRKKRKYFAKDNEKQDRNFWNSVIFSDESKFNIHESDGHQKVWRKANAAL